MQQVHHQHAAAACWLPMHQSVPSHALHTRHHRMLTLRLRPLLLAPAAPSPSIPLQRLVVWLERHQVVSTLLRGHLHQRQFVTMVRRPPIAQGKRACCGCTAGTMALGMCTGCLEARLPAAPPAAGGCRLPGLMLPAQHPPRQVFAFTPAHAPAATPPMLAGSGHPGGAV